MKKTQLTELRRNIKKTVVSFFAILVFVTFSCALFLGLTWTSEAIHLSANEDFQKYRFHDLEIYFPYGATDENIAELAAVDGITDAEGCYKSYQMFFGGNEYYQAEVSSITENINLINRVEGKLPTESNEILIEKAWAESHDFKIGDLLAFHIDDDGSDIHFSTNIMKGDMEAIEEGTPNEDGMKYLNTDTFTVCGLGECPTLISTSPSALGMSPVNGAPVDCIMFVDESAFDKEAFLGYSYVYLRSDGINKDAYDTDSYKENLHELEERVKPVAYRISEITMRTYMKACEEYFELPDTSDQQIIYATVLNRNQSASIALLEISSKSTGELKYCLSFSLMGIALLICYSVVSRLVFEQSVQIGTKKALGFKSGEITRSYLCYTGIASAIGSVLGILIGRFMLEPIIVTQFKNIFTFDSGIYTASVLEPVIIVLMCMAFVLIVTYFSCKKVLKRDTLTLLSGSAETSSKRRFYEKLKIWKKLPLLTKTIINNFFNDKKRVIGTIIGVTGVMTLMTCGLTFCVDISNNCDVYFDKYQKFDYVIYFDNGVEWNAEEKVTELLDSLPVNYCKAVVASGQVCLEDGSSFPTTVFAPEDAEAFDRLMNLKTPDGKDGSIKDGVWLCNSIAANNSMNSGDRITYIDNFRGVVPDLEVSGIFEYYLMSPSAYMTKDRYKEMLNYQETLFNNAFLVDSNGFDMEKNLFSFHNITGVITCNRYKADSFENFDSMSGSFVLMATVFLFMAIMMALLVILNLMITFVEEKRRDLITLMINGYSIKKAKRYIYSDTILLTVIGIILGAVAGTALGYAAIRSICCDSCFFYFAVSGVSILASAGVTVLLVAIITLIALKRIERFKLTEVA